MKYQLGAAAMGLLLGVTLTFVGFADWGTVHRMFVFQDLRLLFTFAGAVALSAPVFVVLARRGTPLPRRRVYGSTVLGAVLFGIGWALTGACPGAALVMIGCGYVPALASLAGIVAGMLLCAEVQRRWLRWEGDSCDR